MNKNHYLGLAAFGLIIPYSQLVPFLLENGLNTSLIIQEITGYRINAFAWLDVLVTAITMILMIIEEKNRLSNWWIPVTATILVGPSCGLPLFMYLRD